MKYSEESLQFLKNWYEELLSGRYEQIQRRMIDCTRQKFCCLGVFAKVNDPKYNTELIIDNYVETDLFSRFGFGENQWNQVEPIIDDYFIANLSKLDNILIDAYHTAKTGWYKNLPSYIFALLNDHYCKTFEEIGNIVKNIYEWGLTQ